MVKKKGKTLKQAKKQEPWLVEDVRVHTALPPQVEGQLRCFCRISISQIIWLTPVTPDLTLVRVKWWGEQGEGSVFKPANVKKGDTSASQVTARYPVRSGPRQFASYLSDMGALSLEVMSGGIAAPIGIAEVPQIGLLSVNRPINGFFPVFSPSEEKLAELQVSVVLEPLMASFDSMGSIPTSDISMETQATQESTLPHAFQPRPHFSQPMKPQDDPFVSPASNQNVESRCKETGLSLPYTTDVKQRLQYDLSENHVAKQPPVREGNTVSITAGGHVVTTSETQQIHSKPTSPQQSKLRTTSRLNQQNDNQVNPATSQSGDLLSVLLERGKKLRNAMAVSSVDSQDQHKVKPGVLRLQDNNSPVVANGVAPVARRSSSGSLLREILEAEKDINHGRVSTSDLFTKDLETQTVDLVVGSPVHKNEFKMLQMMNGGSPGASVSSDAGDLSEAGDPLQEESMLQDLFYRHSESDGSVLSEMTGDEREKSVPDSVAVDDPDNVRPPSRQSSLSNLSLLFPEEQKKKKKKRSTSKTRKMTQRREKTQASKVPRSRSSSRSRSRTRTRSKLRRKASSGSEFSDSEVCGTPRSEISRVSFDMTPSDAEEPVHDVATSNSPDGLSVERLTLLGRVHVARVSVESLTLHTDPDSSLTSNKSSKTKKGKPPRPTTKSKKPCTYFIEYQFPVVATSRDKYSQNTMATEVMRVASKNIKNKVVTFNHRSVFPIMFDGNSIDKWWKSALVFKVFSREAGQKIPSPVGSCGVSLKSILKSESLCLDKLLEVREANKNTSLNSSIKSSLCGIFGQLKARVELASDHREFATALAKTKLAEMSGKAKIVPIPHPPPPKPQPVPANVAVTSSLNSLPPPPFAVQTRPTDIPSQLMSSQESEVIAPKSNHVSQNVNIKTTNIAQVSSERHLQHLAGQTQSQQIFNNGPEPLPLHMLLMVPEGRNLSIQGVPPLHLVNKRPMLLKQQPASLAGSHDMSTRNAYLVCRMFWCNDTVNSTVCWGTLQPQFNFLQVAPVLMTPALLERMRNNFLVIEVWDKKTAAGDDKLIGMVKLSLHQFYMSFRDQKVAAALLKSQYPVIAADNYFGVTDPFTSFQYGQLRVVLAMGSADQVSHLQRIKQDGDGSVVVPERPLHSLERHDLHTTTSGHHPSTDTAVEHVFEVVIEGLRGLKLFDNMMWGETDCFIQYQFPAQAQKKPLSDVRHIAPTMKCYRTATTLCTPDPTFHDCTRHRVLLPEGTPVQRELLTACSNSGGGAGGLPFEVWCRYYHPNIREQVIAKATLPLAKLCAMVTMQKRGEPSIQSFSLPLTQVSAEPENTDAEAKAKVKDSGLMDVTVHYKTQLIKTESVMKGQNLALTSTQVCISVGVIRATGLKTAAERLARLDPGMQYASEVGVNAYVRIKLSFLSDEGERITKTVARTFSPEFTHYLDFPCPLIWTDTKTDGTSLAELLETGEATFEVWHQVPGLNSVGSVGQYVPTGSEMVAGRCLVQKTGDVLLGTTTVHLASLLSHRTGLLGWYPINLPMIGWNKSEVDQSDDDLSEQQGLQRVGGGLELSLRFAHQEDRDKVVNAGRSVGWSSVDGDLEDEGWISEDEESQNKSHHLLLNIQDICFPTQNALLTGQNELDPTAKCYVRYKFYDKAAVSTKLAVLRQNDKGYVTASFHHKHNFVISRSSPFHWYLREERLEVQVWVSYGSNKERRQRPQQRDKLIGSAYIELQSLDNTSRRQHRISGVYALFKPGAASLGGACVHVHITGKLLARGVTQGSDEDEDIELGESDVDYDPEDSFHQLVAGSEYKVKDKFPNSPEHRGPTFATHVFIERAMHLPLVSEKNKCGESQPSTYVSYQTAERSAPSCTSIFPQSCNPTWDHEHHTHLSTELLHQENKNLVLKVWHKPAEASKQPDKSSDRVLGFVSVDLAPLASGLMQICGWYNILDFNGQCKGQIKVSIVPDEPLSHSPQADSAQAETNLPSRMSSFHSSLPVLPSSFHLPSSLPHLQEHVTNIRHHHHALQQQLQRRLDAATASLPTTTSSAMPTTQHWQPRFPDSLAQDDSSKSYLFSSLRKQLDDLDSITSKLKQKLEPHQEDEFGTAASGVILNGTHSGLSTIETQASQENMAQQVATSQSSNLVADSGAYSVENSSENSHRSERQTVRFTPRDPNSSDSGVNRDAGSSVQTSNGLDLPQNGVISTPSDCVNNNNRQVLTESGTPRDILLSLETPRDILSYNETSQGFVPGQMLPSASQGSTQFNNRARNEKTNLDRDIIEREHDDDEEEEDSDGEAEEQFGSYHRYREMLDHEEVEADDEGEDVEIITPRRINDVSGMLAGYHSGRDKDSRLVTNGHSQDFENDHQYEDTYVEPSSDDAQYVTRPDPGSVQNDEGHGDYHDTLTRGGDSRPRTLVDSWLSENRDVEDGNVTPREGSSVEDLDEATPRKRPPSVSSFSKPTLLSNVELLDTMTSTLEKRESHAEDSDEVHVDFSKRQHLKKLLSNIDLESVTSGNTSHRPDSGSSKVSGQSSGLSSGKRNDGIVEDAVEDIEEDLEWAAGDQKEQMEAVEEELDTFFQRQQKQVEVVQSVSTDQSTYATLKHLSLSGDMSAHSSSHNMHHTIQFMHEYGSSQTEINSDRTTEDSGLESGTKSSHDEKETFSMFEADHKHDVPNFFLPPENLQASMRALQAATAAATSVATTPYVQDPARIEGKAQAASELTKKLAVSSKVKFAPVTVKGRQLPTAEETKRIAKIFASKLK